MHIDGNVSIKSENGNPPDFKAFLENISFVGFGVYASQKVDFDSLVDFELTTQQLDRPLTGKGKVTHVVDPVSDRSPFYKIGIEFVDTNKDAVTYLIKRLQAKMAEQARSKSKTSPIDFIPY
jgi:hypothetical protein